MMNEKMVVVDHRSISRTILTGKFPFTWFRYFGELNKKGSKPRVKSSVAGMAIRELKSARFVGRGGFWRSHSAASVIGDNSYQ